MKTPDRARAEPREEVSGVAYVATFAGLLALATISLLLSRVHLGHGELAIAVAIAVAKALLVLFYFMHLVEEGSSSRIPMLVGGAFVALLLGLAAVDVRTRHTFPAAPSPAAAEGFYQR